MNPIRWTVLRLRAIVARRALERDMQDEMREHLDRATERYVARGMSPADARLAARLEFGNVAVLQEEARDARGARWVETLIGDTRFAFRYFVRHKATTAIIVVVLALATGANTMFFSFFQAQFLRPAPAVPDDDAHVRIWARERPTRTAQWREGRFSHPELVALAAGRGFLRNAGDTPDMAAVMSHLVAEQLYGDAMSAVGKRILVNEVPVHV